MDVRRYVPITAWLPAYDRTWLSFDVIAGLTLWGLVVPEGMAYAGIAGLPPQAGLYTLVVSLLLYALLGTSRHLSVGGTSATAALLASSVAAALVASAYATASDPQIYGTYAAAFVLVTGLVFLVAGIARLGFVTQFLSKPVMDGFIVGLAAFVTVGQLNKLFGVEKPEGNTIEKLIGIVSSWLVRFLEPAPLATATLALSLYWAGLTVGWVVSSVVADRYDHLRFTVTCVLALAILVAIAVLVPSLPLSIAAFAAAGVASGPVFPMIVALGGDRYPERSAAVGGSLTAMAVVGSTIYPPAMGLLSVTVGLTVAMLGNALLAVACALALVAFGRTPGATERESQ
jgi:MFS superfamily sulfate permease-like transporter